MVCLESLGSSYHKLDKCGHCFHKPCIDQWFESSGKQSCPTCGYVYGISKGITNNKVLENKFILIIIKVLNLLVVK